MYCNHLNAQRSLTKSVSLVFSLTYLFFYPTVVSAESTSKADTRPNVVWIVLDALRASNLSSMGYDRETTPFLNKVARQGVLATQHFSQANGTLNSVPSYFTGRYFPVFRLGFGKWQEATRMAPPEDKTLTEILGNAGYHTTMLTAHPWMTADCKLSKEFDEWIFVEPARQWWMAYATGDQLNTEVFRWMESKPKGPFFLYLHYLDTHWPHYFPQPFDKWLDHGHERGKDFHWAAKGPFDEKDKEYLRGLYDGSLLYTDQCVSMVLNRFQEAGMMDNTILIISSDHGEALGEDGVEISHKDRHSFDEVIHTPLILVGPGVPSNLRLETLTQNVDIVPTIVDLLHIKTEAKFDGKSLLPLFAGEEGATLHDWIFTKQRGAGVLNDVEPVYIIRDSEAKYVFDPATEKAKMYSVPDNLARRTELHNDVLAEKYKKILEENLTPMWKKYEALPRENPTSAFYEEFRPELIADQKNVAIGEDKESATDNLWSAYSNYLGLCTPKENAPPLQLSIPVPNAKYAVEIDLLKNKDVDGFPVSSVMLLEIEGKKQELILNSSSSKTSFIKMGEVDIGDGALDITLGAGANTHWAIVKGFMLRPISGDANGVQTEKNEDAEKLRSLGYL